MNKLREQYEKETGCEPYGDVEYTEHYVCWLEKKLEESKASRTRLCITIEKLTRKGEYNE